MKILVLLPLGLLLTACQTTGLLDENLPLHTLPPGSRLILNQELKIPAHSAGVLLQDGRVVSDKEVNQYYPHCRLEVLDVRETSQAVTADEFVVRHMQQEAHTVALPGLIKAARRYPVSAPSFYIFRTVLDLRSERQPRVRWLTCLQWGDPVLGQHVSIREIRAALGGIFMLKLPTTPATGNL